MFAEANIPENKTPITNKDKSNLFEIKDFKLIKYYQKYNILSSYNQFLKILKLSVKIYTLFDL